MKGFGIIPQSVVSSTNVILETYFQCYHKQCTYEGCCTWLVCILVQPHHNIVLLLIDVNGGSLFLTSLPLFLSASHCQSLWLCVFGLPTALDSAQINTELSLVLVGLGGLLCSIALFFFSLFSLFFLFYLYSVLWFQNCLKLSPDYGLTHREHCW